MKLIAIAALSAVLLAIGPQAIASDLEPKVLDQMGTLVDTYEPAAQGQETQGASIELLDDWGKPGARDE